LTLDQRNGVNSVALLLLVQIAEEIGIGARFLYPHHRLVETRTNLARTRPNPESS